MKALVNARTDEIVRFEEVEEPAPAPDELVMEVRAFSLNRGELTLLKTRPEGWRPGQDVAGVVVKAAATGGPAVGARVVALADQAGWAERIAIGVRRAAELPREVTFAQAATLPIAGLTALRTLRRGGWLIGKRVLVTGASGAVGSFALQIAVAAGARPSAVVYSEDQRDKAKELGAEEVFLATADATGRYDVVLESVGGKSFEAALEKVRSDGAIVVFGNTSREKAEFEPFQLVAHGDASIVTYRTTPEHAGRTASEDMATLARLVAERKVIPQIAVVLSWREFRRGFEALAGRKVHGKVVFRVDEQPLPCPA